MMQAAKVQLFIRRATDFLDGMQLTRTDQSYWNSSALLAIHSAVSFTDALRSGLGDHDLSADDHRRAVAALQRLLPSSRFEDQTGLKHLQYLIAYKSTVAYGRSRLDHTDYEILFMKAERFARWADKIGIQLKIEGWQNGD